MKINANKDAVPSSLVTYHTWRCRYHRLAYSHQKLMKEQHTLLRINAQFEALATTDALTGTLNHRATNSALETELVRSRRYQHSFALLFFDLDHFKAINDGYGHAAGDAVLKDLVAIAQCTLRTCDVIGRWGGEEFLAILPETHEAGALVAAERLRAEVAAYTFTIGGGIHLTCSIGVVAFPQDAQDRSNLISLADQAMYAAKKLGRNQVRCYSDPLIAALDISHESAHSREEMTILGTVEALAAMAEARNPELHLQAGQVGKLCLQMALTAGMQAGEAQMLEIAGRLHDMGMIAVPEAILRQEEPLSPHDLACLQRHPQRAAEIISHIPSLRSIAPMIGAHHEAWDGSGYPQGISGEDIPLGARVIAVAEAYVILASSVPGMTHEQVLATLRHDANLIFDPVVVDLLDRALSPTTSEHIKDMAYQ